MREAHAALRAAFELAQDSERRGEHDRVMAHLGAFDQLLRNYLVRPMVPFHDYLVDRFGADADRLHALRSARAQLRLLSHEVRDVVQPRKPDPNRSPPALGRTLEEWAASLRETLSKQERDLLPLYRPADAGE